MKKNTANNQAVLPAAAAKRRERTFTQMRKSLGSMGIDTSAAETRARSLSLSRSRKRGRSEAPADVEMEAGEEKKRVHSSKSRCAARGQLGARQGRSRGRPVRAGRCGGGGSSWAGLC
jgi:nucleolar GTP-binding protein